MPWAIKCRSDNQLDGKREYLLGRFGNSDPVPTFMEGYKTALFRTREQARKYAKERFGYIRNRPDLKKEPHGLKTPVLVEVEVQLHEIEK